MAKRLRCTKPTAAIGANWPPCSRASAEGWGTPGLPAPGGDVPRAACPSTASPTSLGRCQLSTPRCFSPAPPGLEQGWLGGLELRQGPFLLGGGRLLGRRAIPPGRGGLGRAVSFKKGRSPPFSRLSQLTHNGMPPPCRHRNDNQRFSKQERKRAAPCPPPPHRMTGVTRDEVADGSCGPQCLL